MFHLDILFDPNLRYRLNLFPFTDWLQNREWLIPVIDKYGT